MDSTQERERERERPPSLSSSLLFFLTLSSFSFLFLFPLSTAEMVGNLEGLSVSDLAKLATRAKTSFTRVHNELDVRLENLKQCYTSPSFEADARQSLLSVRERYDKVMSIYDEIQSKVAEDVWEMTYSAKMTDVESKKSDSESKQASVFTAARKAIEEHEMLLNASIAAPRAAEAGGGDSGTEMETGKQLCP